MFDRIMSAEQAHETADLMCFAVRPPNK